jgi:hypothetical protein
LPFEGGSGSDWIIFEPLASSSIDMCGDALGNARDDEESGLSATQILNHTTAVRAPVKAVNRASTRTIRARVRYNQLGVIACVAVPTIATAAMPHMATASTNHS